MTSERDLLRTLARYIHFNSIFGSGASNLAAEIAARQDLFRDSEEVIDLIADRSVEVAADIFFAAIDEFGGHTTTRRKTHRSLAQATLKATASFFRFDPAQVNTIACLNESTRTAICKVREGYGIGQMLDEPRIFRAIGFHLGSEFLADEEFRVLDSFLCSKHPDLVAYLEKTEVTMNERQYAAYYWIRIHTSLEAIHFDMALNSADCALQYYAGRENRCCIESWIVDGFRAFAAVQKEFMTNL